MPFRCLAVLAAALLFSCNAYAAQAPTYTDGTGKTQQAQGVVILDSSGNPTGAGTVVGSQEQDVTESRTLNPASTTSQQVYPLNGQGTISFNIAGLAASGATVSFFQSNDYSASSPGSATWTSISEVNTGTGAASLSRTTDGQSALGVEGNKAVKFQITSAGSAGSVTLATNISTRSRYAGIRSPVNLNVQRKDGTEARMTGDARGALIPPNAGTANRQITKCSIAANSATITCTINNGTAVASPAGVCPAATDLIATEVRTSVAALGLGLNGQTLTTATDGTAAGTPDMILPTANAYYTLPASPTNAVTAYNPSASPAITVCIQTLRQ